MNDTIPETTLPVPSVRDVLVAAREVLQERGWTKFMYVTDTGCVCALGALSLAVTDNPIPPRVREHGLFGDALGYLIRASGATGDARFGPVEQFNNAEDTTEGDIYDLFDRAIAAAEAQP